MKVLIGYDGSDCSLSALDELARAGLPVDTEALVFSIAEVWLPSETRDTGSVERKPPASVQRARARAVGVLHATEAMAAQAADRLRANFPGWNVSSGAAADSPAWGLLKKGDDWKPDLIVVGSHGHSMIGRLVLGSVSQKVLTESRTSVRIARGVDRDANEPERILIGYDGSPDAQSAIEAVCERAWTPGSAVHLVSVIDPLVAASTPPLGSGDPEWGDEPFEDEIHWIGESHSAGVERLRATGLIASSRVREGDPKKVLPEEAESWGADCIVLGARGLSTMERFLLGSVSSAIAARSHCSVEVVRRQL